MQNPNNGVFSIEFYIPIDDQITIKIYNQETDLILEETANYVSGNYNLNFNLNDNICNESCDTGYYRFEIITSSLNCHLDILLINQ